MAAQDLCTLSDVKTALEITDTSRDPLISALITQASDAIMNDTGREFAPATASATRRFRVDGFTVSLEPYDLRTATTVTLHPESTSPQTLTAGSDYYLQPVGAPSGVYMSLRLSSLLSAVGSSQTAYSFGFALLDITGAWGFTSVPTDVVRACVVTVSAWMRRDVTSLLSQLETGPSIGPLVALGFAVPKAAKDILAGGGWYRLNTWVR